MRRTELLAGKRVRLRKLDEADAGFIIRLLNEPDFLQFIGDRGVRTAEDARSYLAAGPQRCYREHGFGLLLVERTGDAMPIGICGLVSRAGLDAPDLGFAFMPEFRGLGYAEESARLAVRHAFEGLAIDRVVAIVAGDNVASIRLLEKLGMQRRGTIRLPEEETDLLLFELRNSRTSRAESDGAAVSGTGGE